MSLNSILKHFMLFESTEDTVQKRYKEMNNFLTGNDNHLQYDDIVKFCETILRFASSDQAISNLDGLIVLQTFVERLSKSLFTNFDNIIKHLFKCSDIDDEEVITVSSDLFFYMMKNYSPKYVWDHILLYLPNLNENAKEFFLDLLEETFTKFGINSLDHQFIVSCLHGLKQDVSLAKKIHDKSNLLIRYISNKDTYEKKIQADLNDTILKLEIELDDLKQTLSKMRCRNQDLDKKIVEMNKMNEELKDMRTCLPISPSKSSDNESIKENIYTNIQKNTKKPLYSKYGNLLIPYLDCNSCIEEKDIKGFIKKEIKKRTNYWYNATRVLKDDNNLNIYFSCNKKDSNSKCNSKLIAIVNNKTRIAKIFQNQIPHSHK